MISILTITNNKNIYAYNFLEYNKKIANFLDAKFIVAYDRCDPLEIKSDKNIFVECKNNIVEDVLSYCYSICPTNFVLRLDDDEILDKNAIIWIKNAYKKYKFNRVGFKRLNLIDTNHIVQETYPDIQVRLIKKDLEKRKNIHEGMNIDKLAKGNIVHYNILAKNLDQRIAIANNYDKVSKGSGFGDFAIFNIPDKVSYIKQKINFNLMFKFDLF